MGSIFYKKFKKWVFDLLFPHFRFHFLAGVFGMSTPIWARCLIWATYRLLHSLVLRLSNLINLKFKSPGSGYGAVGRAVASNTRDPRFESSHRQYYILSTQLKNCIEKTKIEKKQAGNGPFLKKTHLGMLDSELPASVMTDVSLMDSSGESVMPSSISWRSRSSLVQALPWDRY